MKLLTTKQAAEILAVSVKTVKRWRKSGQLIPVQTGDNGYSAYSYEQLKNFKLGTQTGDTNKTGDTEKFNVPTLQNVPSLTYKNVPSLNVPSLNVPSLNVPSLNVPSLNADVPTFETVSAKLGTRGLHGGKNTMKQQLENLPEEILRQARFFPVSENKMPKLPGWQKPENQKPYTEIDGPAGFDCSGHDVAPDYCLLDFDHVLDNDGNFINADAAEIFVDVINALDTNIFCEKSVSGHGLHILVRPTAGKFGKLSAGAQATLYFDDERRKDSPKLEIFYMTGGRYVLLTGERFKCVEGATIPSGAGIDTVLQYLLERIQDKLPKKENPIPEKKNSAPPAISDNAEQPSEPARACAMLDCIVVSELGDTDWLAMMSACKNLGIDYSLVDAKNTTDPERYNENENLKRWESITDSSFGIETLHGLAKRFGYSEKDFQREWYSEHSPKKFQDNRAAGRGEVEENSAPDTEMEKLLLADGDKSDFDFAQRIINVCGKMFRFIGDSGKWTHYNGQVWTPGKDDSSMFPLARITLKKLEENRLYGLANTLKKRSKMSAAIGYIPAFTEVVIQKDDFDNHPYLLNCKNGTLDLTTGKFYPHCAEHLLTQQINAEYKPGYRHEDIDNFFETILPDEQTRAALIRYLGYSLTADVREEVAMFIAGVGRNGKGTLANVLLTLLGSYGCDFPIEGILEQKFTDANAATPAYTKLYKRRLAVANEIPQNKRLDAAKFKLLTGGDRIPIRRLREEATEILPTSKFIFSGNYMPELIDANDVGIQRRLLKIDFKQDFSGERADTSLKQKLITPDALNGLLTVLVDAAKEWYSAAATGKSGLIISDAMTQSQEDYFADNDFIATFIDEHCERGAKYSIERADLIKQIRANCNESKEMSDRALVSAIGRKKGVEYKRGKGGYKFFGIRFSPDFAEQQDFISPEDLPFEE